MIVIANHPALKIESDELVYMGDTSLCIMKTETGKVYTLVTVNSDDGLAEKLVYPNGRVLDLDVNDPADVYMDAIVKYLHDNYA